MAQAANGKNRKVHPDYVDNWHEYWLLVANAVSKKSKDSKCQVGAVIVQDGIVLSTGFNGFARNVFDDPDLIDTDTEKFKWMCHAEQNAVLNAARLGVAVEGATIYVNKFPCFACCKIIIQAGIGEIHTHDHWFWDDDPEDGKDKGDHWRKRSVLRQAKIKVSAPFHPEYMERNTAGSFRVASPTDATPVDDKTKLAPDEDRKGVLRYRSPLGDPMAASVLGNASDGKPEG